LAGLRASAFGASTMAGNMTEQASVSNNRRRALLSRAKFKFAAIPLRNTWVLSLSILVRAKRRPCPDIRNWKKKDCSRQAHTSGIVTILTASITVLTKSMWHSHIPSPVSRVMGLTSGSRRSMPKRRSTAWSSTGLALMGSFA